MAWTDLPTNYEDVTWAGRKRYSMIDNGDGTVSFDDVTEYTHLAESFFGAGDANSMNAAINMIMAIIGNGLSHNGFYRGKSLGNVVTDTQWGNIQNGTFDDLFIGDYWTINDVNWRIAAFDYYMYTGSATLVQDHHVVIVPDSLLGSAAMNSTATTAGAYAGSAMRSTNMESAKATIISAFGEEHILTHRMYFANAVTDGRPSAGGYVDADIELMSERNVYGGPLLSPVSNGTNIPSNYTLDRTQFPLFFFNNEATRWSGTYWLRDVVSGARFAVAGTSANSNANNSQGIRPSFCII